LIWSITRIYDKDTSLLIKVPPDVIRQVTAGHDRLSRTYHDPNPVVRLLNWGKLKSLISMVQGTSFSVILDYACGNGILLPTLANLGKTVIGFDLFPEPAKKIVTLYGLRSAFVMKANAMRIPLDNASVDLIIAANVLEHFKELTIPLKETGDEVLLSLSNQMKVEEVRYFPNIMIKELAVYHLIKARKG